MKAAIVGLDLSLGSTGIAVISGDGGLTTHSYGEKLPAGAGEGYKLMRLHRIAQWACNTIDVYVREAPVRVAYESYAFSGNGLTRLAEQSIIVRSQIFLRFRTVPIPVTAEEARKFLFGSSLRPKRAAPGSKASKKRSIKADVIARLAARGFKQPKNSDEADALVVALVMDAYVNKRDQRHDPYQMELFSRLDERRS